jgi:ABC-type phosphate/phosphonate transport system substrate-binding protein
MRFGISSREVSTLNRTDIKAALKAWILSVLQERNLSVDPVPVILDSPAEMVEALRQKQIDMITAPTDQYLEVERQVPMGRRYATTVGGRIHEQYLLLVRSDDVATRLQDLAGQTLFIYDGPRNSMSSLWLDTELMRAHLPPSGRLCGKVNRTGKLDLAILPVFFRQARAAVAARSGFELACELNPQLAKELRVLARSPDLVPAITSYRIDAHLEVLENYDQTATHLRETTAGKQLLGMFQIDGVVEVQPAELAATQALVKDYQRLKAEYERGGAR